MAMLLTAVAFVSAPRDSALAATTCDTPALSGVSLPSLAYVGDQPTLTVALSCAPASDVTVDLASTNSHLPVPATMQVVAGATTASVALTPQAYQPGQYQSTISATYSGQTDSTQITVDPGLSQVYVDQSGDEPNAVDFLVLLTGTAPAGGETIQISSSSPLVTMPASVTIQQYGAGEDLNATSVQEVTQDSPFTLFATLGSRTLSATGTLVPPFAPGDSISLFQEDGTGSPIYGGDYDLQYNALLSNPAGDNGLTIDVTTPNPAALQLQEASVYVTGGFVDGSFEVNVGHVKKPVHTSVSASADGVSTTLPVTIEPGITGVYMPAKIRSGQNATGVVTLAGPVDTDTTVVLNSTWGVLDVPGTVTIPKGRKSATFPITTIADSGGDQVSVYAYLGTTSLSATTTLS